MGPWCSTRQESVVVDATVGVVTMATIVVVGCQDIGRRSPPPGHRSRCRRRRRYHRIGPIKLFHQISNGSVAVIAEEVEAASTVVVVVVIVVVVDSGGDVGRSQS